MMKIFNGGAMLDWSEEYRAYSGVATILRDETTVFASSRPIMRHIQSEVQPP